MRTLSFLLLLPPLFAAPFRQDEQEPRGGDEAPIGRDIYGRPLKTTGATDEIVKQLIGCWRLVAIDDAEFPNEGRSQIGYMLIEKDFLALELHVAWDDEEGEMVDDDFQSGIHEYRVLPTGVLVTTCLIGSFLEEYGPSSDLDLEWEDPGTVRKFQMRLAGNFLTLQREDGSRLSFSRQPARRTVPKDVFGRERKEPGGESKEEGGDGH